MKKLLIFVVIALLSGAIGTSLVPRFVFWKNCQISESQYLRLSKGMTREEVNSALGVAPGDYTNGEGEYLTGAVGRHGQILAEFYMPDCCPLALDRHWFGHQGMIECFFDEEGNLVKADYYSRFPQPTAWERIEDWLPFGK